MRDITVGQYVAVHPASEDALYRAAMDRVLDVELIRQADFPDIESFRKAKVIARIERDLAVIAYEESL